MIGVAVLVIFGLCDGRPGELVFLSKKAFDFRAHLLKGEGVVQGGEVGHQLIGIVADLAHAAAVFVIAGMGGFGAADIQLQIRFQFCKIQFRIADILLIRQTGSGQEGGLPPGQHGGAGGQPRRKKGDH